MKNNLMKLLAIVTLCVSAANALAQESTEAVSTNNGIISLILEILLALIGGAAAVYFCWHIVVTIKKKKEEKSTSTTGTESPIVNVDTHGANSGIDNKGGIMGNNNTIQNGLSVEDVLKLTRQSQPTQPANVPGNLDMDKKLVEKFFSRFSNNIFKEFVSMHNPAYLDKRIFDIRDGWYDLYNPIEPPFIDEETKSIFDEFYKALDALVLKCAYAYEMSANPKLCHIRGMVGDVFDNPKDEENFDAIVEGIKKITPIYEKIIKFVIRTYKIDLDALSSDFENRHQ